MRPTSRSRRSSTPADPYSIDRAPTPPGPGRRHLTWTTRAREDDPTIEHPGRCRDVADDAHARRERRTRRRWVTRDGLSTLVFLLPFLFVFGLFSWFPILRAFVMSVQETNLVSDPDFVGLENFRRVLADPLLGIAVANTAWFALLALLFGFPIPIILAVLISETRSHRGLYSALVYLPVVIPPVVVRPALAVLLQRRADRGVQLDPRRRRDRAAAVAPERGHGDALDRHRGDLGRRRRHGDHLSRGAHSASRRSCTRRPRSTARRSGRRSGTSRCPRSGPCCS